jgi:hypothetical protein
LCGLTCHPNNVLACIASTIEKKQRDVEAIDTGETAIELTSAFDDLRQTVDASRYIDARGNREKEPTRHESLPTDR